jgi:hypothetical protein
VGPSVGGVLIAGVGEAWCFAFDAVSYVAVVGSLLATRLRPPAPARRDTHALDELRAGWRYVSASVPIRTALLLLALVSTFGTRKRSSAGFRACGTSPPRVYSRGSVPREATCAYL